MGKAPGLTRKGAAYFYRRRVPEDIRAVLGKQEMWVALGTKDYLDACAAARRAAVAADEQIAKARSGALVEEREVKAAISDAALQQLAQRHLFAKEQTSVGYREQSDREELERDAGALMLGGQHAPQVFSVALRLANDNGVETGGLPSAERLLRLPAKQVRQLVASPSLLRLIEFVRRAELEHILRRLDRLDGLGGDAAHDPLFAGVSTTGAPPKPTAIITLGDALHRFKNDPVRSRLGDTADGKYIRTFQAMQELLGETKPLAEITRADCATVQELIARLPANFTKLNAYKNCNGLQQVAALAEERASKFNDRMMSVTTVRGYTLAQSSFFNWCIRKGLLAVNPAMMMAPARGASETSRRPFNVAELNKIVAALPSWSDEGKLAGRKWVPLIAMLTGMRLGEIVTLTVGEIGIKDGASCIILRRTAEKALKTDGAERVVPIHPDLERLGFLEHVEVIRDSGLTRLFPDLSGNSQDQVADLFQKRFAYFHKQKLGIAEKGVSFHCFRHGFRDALREAGVPSDVTRALGGWSRSGGVEERYGQGTRVATLAKWMARVGYAGLDLSPIMSN